MAMRPTGIEVIARGIIRRDDTVLLVRVTGQDWWFLPGGHVEPGEPVAEALAREMREEVGAHAVVGDQIATVETFYTDARGDHHELNLVFIVEDPGGELLSLEPHIETAWLRRQEVAEAEIRPDEMGNVLASAWS